MMTEGDAGVVAAAIGIIGAVVVSFVTAYFTTRNQHKKLREELKLEYSIEAAIVHLLENPNYQMRGLDKIKYHLRGFKNDDELRMALIRAGAVAVTGSGGKEMWGLLKRNQDKIK